MIAGQAPSGQVFDKWVVVSGGITLADENSATTTFTMPAGDVSVKATYHTHSYGSEWETDASKHWHACSRCDAKADETAHTPDREPATETDPIKCSVCDYIITPALGHTHSLTKVEAKAPTFTEDGNIEYYTCSGCSKLFADATGNVEISADKTVDKATGHQYAWVIDKEATETETGIKHEECVCGAKRNENTVIPVKADNTEEEVKTNNSKKSPATGNGYETLALFAIVLASGSGIVAVSYGRKKKRKS